MIMMIKIQLALSRVPYSCEIHRTPHGVVWRSDPCIFLFLSEHQTNLLGFEPFFN